MNYELLKQLKDTGFPQNVKRPEFDFEKDNTTGEVVVVPTLSQLIEACGATFASIERLRKPDEEGMFWASSDNHATGGATPEEAVANLWLSLNKK